MSEQGYVPELGQGIFGGPWEELDSPGFITPGLDVLGLAVAEFSGNEDLNPCYNSGAVFENEVFALRAYCWCDGATHNWEADELCPANFEHFESGFAIRWYKHSHRGRSQNRGISSSDWRAILSACSNSIPAEPCTHGQRTEPEHPWAPKDWGTYWECSTCAAYGFEEAPHEPR